MKYTRRRYKTRKNVRRKTRRGGAFANRGRGGAFANRGRAGRNADCREFLAKPAVIAFMKQYLKKKSGKFNPTLEDLKRIEINFDELREAYPDLASCYLNRYQMKSARNTWIDELFPGKNQNVKAVKLNAVKNLPRLPARGPVVAPAAASPAASPAASAIVASPAASIAAVEAVSDADADADVNAEAEAASLFSTLFGTSTVNPKVAARLAAARRGTPPDPTHTVVAPTSAAAQHLNAVELNVERGEGPTGVAAQHHNALGYNAENPPGEDLISELRNQQLGLTGIQEYKDLFQYVNGESMTHVVNTFNFENDQGLLFRIAKFLMLLYDEYDEDDTLASYAHFLSPLSTKIDTLLRDNTLAPLIKNEFQKLKNILPAPEGYFENVDG